MALRRRGQRRSTLPLGQHWPRLSPRNLRPSHRPLRTRRQRPRSRRRPPRRRDTRRHLRSLRQRRRMDPRTRRHLRRPRRLVPLRTRRRPQILVHRTPPNPRPIRRLPLRLRCKERRKGALSPVNVPVPVPAQVDLEEWAPAIPHRTSKHSLFPTQTAPSSHVRTHSYDEPLRWTLSDLNRQVAKTPSALSGPAKRGAPKRGASVWGLRLRNAAQGIYGLGVTAHPSPRSAVTTPQPVDEREPIFPSSWRLGDLAVSPFFSSATPKDVTVGM